MTAIMLISAIVFSTVVYLNVERTVLKNEYETNQKILNQMKYNINFLDDMVKNLCLSTYYSDDVKSLMNFTGEESFEQMNIINKLGNSVVASTPYVQSIYVYNNRKKEFYSTYKAFKYEDQDLIKVISSYTNIPILKPIFRRTETYHSGDVIKYSNVLTYFMYEMTDSKNNMQGAVMINIKLDWLIENIKLINQFNDKRQDKIFILDENGEFIRDTGVSDPEETEFEDYIRSLQSTKDTDAHGNDISMLTGKIGSANYFVSCIPIQEVSWVMYKIQPYDMVFDYINKLKATIIIISFIIFILILISSYTLSRGLYKPFEGLLRLVGFGSEASMPIKKGGDEFSYLQEVYKNSIDQIGRYRLEKSSDEKIIKKYFLKKLLLQSVSITREEFEVSKSEHGISLNPDEPFIVILLVIDSRKEFEEQNDVQTRDLFKFAIMNITSEILNRSFHTEAVEMKNDEIVYIVNTGNGTKGVVEQLAVLLREVQENILKHFKISFTAVISEESDKVNKLTLLYTKAVNYSMYRYIYGLMSVITPDMLKDNLSDAQYDHSYEKQKRLVEAVKQYNLKVAEGVLKSLLDDARRMEYNNMMLSLARIVNAVKDAIFDLNQTRKDPININAILANQEIFERETIEEFGEILMDVLQNAIVNDPGVIDSMGVQTAEAVRRIISDSFFDYNLSVTYIADRLMMSSAKISKSFKENMCMSVPEYINNVRLAKAVEWMENSRLSVSEIMLKVGIENESYFYKIFKAKYGATPREYIAGNVHREL